MTAFPEPSTAVQADAPGAQETALSEWPGSTEFGGDHPPRASAALVPTDPRAARARSEARRAIRQTRREPDGRDILDVDTRPNLYRRAEIDKQAPMTSPRLSLTRCTVPGRRGMTGAREVRWLDVATEPGGRTPSASTT